MDILLISKATGDKQFVKDNIDSMEKEFNFWIDQRTTKVQKNGKEYTLARYNVEVDMPRPGR